MTKFSVMVTKSPHASTGPAFCASSSGKCCAEGFWSRRVSFLRLPDFLGQRNVKVGEINVADKAGDGRHDDVRDERADNFSERRADDDADGEVDDIAAQRELFELLQDRYFHSSPFDCGNISKSLAWEAENAVRDDLLSRPS